MLDTTELTLNPFYLTALAPFAHQLVSQNSTAPRPMASNQGMIVGSAPITPDTTKPEKFVSQLSFLVAPMSS